jgi:hypothetical protein
MRKVLVFITLMVSGVVLSITFGLMLVMRMISIFQMNHARAVR